MIWLWPYLSTPSSRSNHICSHSFKWHCTRCNCQMWIASSDLTLKLRAWFPMPAGYPSDNVLLHTAKQCLSLLVLLVLFLLRAWSFSQLLRWETLSHLILLSPIFNSSPGPASFASAVAFPAMLLFLYQCLNLFLSPIILLLMEKTLRNT